MVQTEEGENPDGGAGYSKHAAALNLTPENLDMQSRSQKALVDPMKVQMKKDSNQLMKAKTLASAPTVGEWAWHPVEGWRWQKAGEPPP